MNAPLLTVALSLAYLAASGADSWTFLPPRDVDPALAGLANPIPRKWSGQKASLAFAEITRGEGSLTLDWSAAAAAKGAPKLPGDPRSLWKGRTPPKDPVTEPRLYAVGRDLRLFRDTLPPASELLPFVVVVDGNPEDGYGGYVLGADGDGEWSLTRTEASITIGPRQARPAPAVPSPTPAGPSPELVAHRFDGNWIAGLQTAARAWPARFAAPDGMSADLWISVVAEWVQDAEKWNAPAEGWAESLAARRARRARLLADPRLAATLEKGILFCTRRNPSWNHCVAQYFGWRQRPGGSLLVLERPGRSLATRDVLAGRMPSGTCLEPRLSFDARTALFAFVETQGPLDPFSMPVNERGGDDHYFHLWRVNVDGSGLAQLTRGVYEDFMPCWLPDGDVAFMSTRRRSQSRCFWYGYSNRWQAYTLFRMKADGSDMRQLSWNDVSEWFPALSAEGEILFARWDYIDRDAVRHQNLWSMRPDGTNPKAVWGNETPSPHCTFQPCAVPGSGKVACIASAHHAVTGGPLVLIDPSVDENSEAAVTHVTPGHYPECEDKNKHDYDDPSPAAHNDWYNSPWAYGEDLFLVCWSRDPMGYEPSRPIPDAALGLYVLAADGTRELLWRDGQYGAGAPQPLVPRATPPLVRSQLDPALAAQKKGEVFISDVARGLPGAPTGTVRRVRVVELYPRTAPDQYLPLLGAGGHENGRGVIGTADVEADGSVRFLVPAEKQLFFQVLDADGFTWRTMRSSTSVMPGERVSCVGCHEPKREASATAKRLSRAMQRPAQELAVPPEGGRPWGFTENVQPIFDRKCVSCHSGANPPKGVALTREEDPRFPSRARVKGIFGAKNDRLDWGMVCAPFSRAYATLIFTDEKTRRGSDYKPFQRWKRRRGTDRAGRPADMVPCWPEYNPVQTTPEGPGNNALGSGLMGHLSRGNHAAFLTPEEKRMIATWIDLNALFYGNCEEPGLSRQFRGEPVAYPERVVVTDAGADPTGRADSTPAMQACIDRVAAAGGGTVSVPPGEYRISFLTLRPHVTLELAGGAGRATDGWTPEVAARAMDPTQSAIIRSVADRKGRWWLFLFNLVPPTAATNGFSDITVSGGVFDCEGRYLPGAFACGRNIRIENVVVKDLPNNHAFQIDGCTNVVVTNCLFAGYTFGGKHKVLTRETIQVEQTSPGALSGNPKNTPISCAPEVSIPNRNVSVTGCWFGPSERLGPHLIPLGHHGRPRSCDGLVFAGNVVVNPLYCGVRLANVSDVRVEGNTFISTNATPRLAKDSAVVCLWGKKALAPGEKGVEIRGNRVVLAPESPLRCLWVSEPRAGEVTSCAAAAAPEGPVVRNGGFEDVKDGQTVGWNAVGRKYVYVDGAGRSGTRALAFENDDPKFYSFPGQRIELKAGKSYRYEVWVRTENLKGDESGASICIEWNGPDGKWLGGAYTSGVKGTKDWTRVAGVTQPIPPNARSFRVSPYVRKGMTGKAWFDDISVTPFVRAPVTGLYSSAYRNLAASGSVTFKAALGLDADEHPLSEVRGVLRYTDADGARREAAAAISADEGVVTLDVARLALGAQDVSFVLVKGGKEVGTATCRFTRVEKMPTRAVWFDEFGRTIVNGEPFFPLGMYWGGITTNKFEIYAKGPFNCLMPYASPNSRDLMDLCHAHGVKVIYSVKDVFSGTHWAPKGVNTEADEVAYITARVSKFKDHPALLAWYLNDELPLSMLPRLSARRDLMERLDPGHPGWVVLYQYSQIADYMPSFDVIGTDPYPIPRPAAMASMWTRATRKGTMGLKPLWQVPQAFDWAAYKKTPEEKAKFRAPTEAELRSMCWQCIACGANGLVLYSWYDLWKEPNGVPFAQRWAEVCRVGQEIKEQIPVLLAAGPAPSVSGAPEELAVRTWGKDGAAYVLVVNTTDKPFTASLTLSEPFAAAQRVFGPEPKLAGASLGLALAPLEPALVRLNR